MTSTLRRPTVGQYTTVTLHSQQDRQPSLLDLCIWTGSKLSISLELRRGIVLFSLSRFVGWRSEGKSCFPWLGELRRCVCSLPPFSPFPYLRVWAPLAAPLHRMLDSEKTSTRNSISSSPKATTTGFAHPAIVNNNLTARSRYLMAIISPRSSNNYRLEVRIGPSRIGLRKGSRGRSSPWALPSSLECCGFLG